MAKVINQCITENYALYNADCCEVIKDIPSNSIGMSVFSPPFAELYAYSDSERDMGNCGDYKSFFEHFSYLTSELNRVMMPGRVVAVHCMDLPAHKERDGYIGTKDFPGDLIRCFQSAGFIYHSRCTIWKDPLTAAVRTKAIGLAHKSIVKDSAICRCGYADYLIAFRKDGDNPVPISHDEGLSVYYGADDPGGSGVKRSHNIWRSYASPVWMDIRQGNTLNKHGARDPEDKKHICPLQLDVIERAHVLWSTEGDTVLTPFMGIGSEAHVAVKNRRKAIGIELKESYYSQAVKNVRMADENKVEQGKLF